MRRQGNFIRLILVVSILAGIILPIVPGVKDPTLIAVTFSSMWLIYGIGNTRMDVFSAISQRSSVSLSSSLFAVRNRRQSVCFEK